MLIEVSSHLSMVSPRGTFSIYRIARFLALSTEMGMDLSSVEFHKSDESVFISKVQISPSGVAQKYENGDPATNTGESNRTRMVILNFISKIRRTLSSRIWDAPAYKIVSGALFGYFSFSKAFMSLDASADGEAPQALQNQ